MVGRVGVVNDEEFIQNLTHARRNSAREEAEPVAAAEEEEEEGCHGPPLGTHIEFTRILLRAYYYK